MADISKINPNGTEYNLKDATARAGIESSQTLKSSVVTVNDAAPINAEDITVDITPVQDLHGYDRPWAGGGWKNKLPMTVAGIKAVNTVGAWSGNTWTYDNNSFTILTDSGNNVIGIRVNGSFSANVNFRLTLTGDLGLNGLTLSGASGGVSVLAFDDTQRAGSSSVIPNNFHNYRIFLSSGTGIKDVTIYPMVSAEGGAFAPYSNECPIEGRTGAELDRVGKNWLSSPMEIGNIGSGGINYDGTGAMRTVGYIPILANTEYSYSQASNSSEIWVHFYDENKVFLSRQMIGSNNNNGWFTAINNASFVRMRCNLPTENLLIGDNQLELGTQPTAYEPYQGQQYTANFGETVYGGTVNFNTGKLVVDTVIDEFDGSSDESWAIWQSGGHSFYGYTTSDHIRPAVGTILESTKTNYLKLDTPAHTYASYEAYTVSTDVDSKRFSIVLGEDITSVSQCRSYLASKPLQVCYKLATPFIIDLTPTQIKMLKGINTVSADCGDTQLKYQTDNVIGELKGEIRAVEAELAEVEENLEIVYEDHVANTSMGIIVDGYSVGDMPFSNALDIAKPGYIPIAVTDTSVVLSSVADQGDIATHCLLDVTNNRVRFYVHVMDSAASLTIPPNSLTFRVAYKKA